MLKNKLDLNHLKESYLISNTPLFLFKSFSNESSLQEFKLRYNTETLIEEFSRISQEEIDTIEDLVYAYALYIAILLKDDELTNQYIKDKGDINFEWFKDLKSIYKEKVTPTYLLEINKDYSIPSKKVSKKTDDNTNDIELEFA